MAKKTLKKAKWFWQDYPGTNWNNVEAANSGEEGLAAYAYPKGTDGLVDIEAILKEHSLEFIITDSGVPFDPTAAPEADITLTADERPIGGLGIFMVRKLMDEVHYQHLDDKNVLKMIKNI